MACSTDADPARARRNLLLVAALLVALAVAVSAAAGAWQLLRQQSVPKLDLSSPAQVEAFARSAYDRMPQMPPVEITTLSDGGTVGRLYVDSSGAVRLERYVSPDAKTPDTYEILKGTTMAQLASVGSEKVWVSQGAIAEDPRVFLLTVLEGDGVYTAPECAVAVTPGDGTSASGWTYVGTEAVLGRPTAHLACAGGDIWIDIETRLIMRSRGPARDEAYQPIPGTSRTTEVTSLVFGEQPAFFELTKPSGVASMTSEEYQCRVAPDTCVTATPEPAWTPPPDAVRGPLASVAPSHALNGWIAYATGGPMPG